MTWRRSFQAALALLAILLVLATLIPTIVSNQWWIRIFVFPQVQITGLLILVALLVPFVFNMKKAPGLTLAAALVASIVYQLQYLLLYTPLWAKQIETAEACPADRAIRVLVLNVRAGDVANPPVLDVIAETRPDLFLALETEPEWLERMAVLGEQFEHRVEVPRPDAWGMALYSRLPLAGTEVRYLVDDYVPSIKTRIELGPQQSFNFYGLHPKPPLMHDTARGDAEVIRAGREIAASSQPAILAGDLNDVPWSYTTQRFLRISGMLDPRVGRAFDPTFWPDKPLLGWPLDHAFATGHFSLARFDPLPDVGSDHAPLLADFCYRGARTEELGRSAATG